MSEGLRFQEDPGWLERAQQEALDNDDYSFLDDAPPAVAPAKTLRPRRHPALKALYDDVTPAEKTVPASAVANVEPKYRSLVKALRRLKPYQRTYLRALASVAFNQKRAIEIMHDKMFKLDRHTVIRWLRTPDFALARQKLGEHFLGLAGIDPETVLVKLDHIADDAMTPVPVLYQGEDTGFREVDRGSALRALELIGKNKRMWGGDENGPRVVVQIVELDGPQKGAVIDNESGTVDG